MFWNRVSYTRHFKFQQRCTDLCERLSYMYMDILRDTLRDVDWNRCIFRSIDYDGEIIAGDSVTYTYRFTTKLPLYLVCLLNINRNADSPIIEIHVCLLLINDICWVSVFVVLFIFPYNL